MTKNKFPLLTPEYLRKRWVEDEATLEEIAAEVGCSVGNVMKRRRDWKVFRRGVIKRPSWNSGLTKDTDSRVAWMALTKEGEMNPMHGRPAWNKGLTPEMDERVATIVKAMRDGFAKPETRIKMADAKMGLTGDKSNRWKDGTTRSGAYQEGRGTFDGRRMYIHRKVAEDALKRTLLSTEHVHHIDRVELNNSPENLLVLSDSDHSTLHGAIYRGECSTRSEQIDWLTKMRINFESLI
jgi:hypothetical protein